jgi:hypothetical protein
MAAPIQQEHYAATTARADGQGSNSRTGRRSKVLPFEQFAACGGPSRRARQLDAPRTQMGALLKSAHSTVIAHHCISPPFLDAARER